MDRIQLRRDTAARWSQHDPILLEGEVGYVMDNPNQYKIGNGVHTWNELPLRGFDGTVTQGIGNDTGAVMSQKAVSSIIGLDTYPTFSTAYSYNKGRVVNYNGLLYRFTVNHTAGAWNDEEVEECSLKDDYKSTMTEFQRGSGVIIAGSNIDNSEINSYFGKVIIDAEIYSLTEDNQVIGVIAIENGIKYDSGDSEYRRYGLLTGLWQWKEDGTLERTSMQYESCTIERPVGSDNYDTYQKSGVERIVSSRGNVYVIDWDAMNTVISPNSDIQISCGTNDIRLGKINPSKYYKVKFGALDNIDFQMMKTAISTNTKSIYVGIVPNTGAERLDNETMRIAVGGTGNGCNIGSYFEFAAISGEMKSPKDVYFALHYKVISGKAPNMDVMSLAVTNTGNKNTTPTITKVTENEDGSFIFEAIYKDIRSILGNDTLSRLYLGYSINNTTPISGTAFQIQLANATITYTTYPEYSGDSGSRKELNAAISNLKSEIESNEDRLKIFNKNFAAYPIAPGVTKINDNTGLNIPANTDGYQSYVQATFDLNGMKLGSPITLEAYFFLDNTDIIGIRYFFTYDKDGTRHVNMTSATKVEEGLYRARFTYTPTETSLGYTMAQFAWQIVAQGQTSSNPTNIILKSTCWYQDYNSENGDEGYNNFAVKKIAESLQEDESVTEIVVTADENADGFSYKGANAVQLALNSITDASPSKRYRILAMPGLYKITNSSQFLGNPGYPAMICMKDYVDVVGHSKDSVIFWAELPYTDSEIDSEVARERHQTVWNYAKDAHMKNCTLVAKNIRYTIHQDSIASALSSRYYENVDLIFLGDKGFLNCWGLGSWNGEENYVKGGKCMSVSGNPYSCHNNTNFKYPSKWSFQDHQFFSVTNKTGIITQNCGSLLNDVLELIGCSFGGAAYEILYNDLWLRGGATASFNHAEWRIVGHGNNPFLFTNNVGGLSLRVTSKSKGNTSTVRFLKSSTAFEALIKNPNYTDGISIAIPEIEIVDSYIVKDGSEGLSGWANGCRDLSGKAYTYDEGVIYDSLGKNLGDCSSNNKTLIIVVDGASYTVTFNKNYTNMDNSTILSEINAVIGTVATAELYSIGQEYYPEIPDVMEYAMNESTSTPIERGTVVTKTNAGRVKPCDDGEKIFGVALDDIPVYSMSQGVPKGYGRIMKRGYIYTSGNGYKHFVKATSEPEVGTRMKVVNGQLVADTNGECVGIASGVISINC